MKFAPLLAGQAVESGRQPHGIAMRLASAIETCASRRELTSARLRWR